VVAGHWAVAAVSLTGHGLHPTNESVTLVTQCWFVCGLRLDHLRLSCRWSGLLLLLLLLLAAIHTVSLLLPWYYKQMKLANLCTHGTCTRCLSAVPPIWGGQCSEPTTSCVTTKTCLPMLLLTRT
jgi:hypothetical protein